MNVATLFDNLATNATAYSKWIPTRGATGAVIQLVVPSASSPDGAFTLEFSNDPQAGKEAALNTTPAAGTANSIDVTSVIDPGAIVGTGLTVSGANNTMISLSDPPAFIRVKYTRSSGGTTSGLKGWLSLSGVSR